MMEQRESALEKISSREDEKWSRQTKKLQQLEGGDREEMALSIRWRQPLLGSVGGCLWGHCDQGTGEGPGSGLGTPGIRPAGSAHCVRREILPPIP